MAILRSPANAEKNKRGFLLQTLPAPFITDLAFLAPLPLPVLRLLRLASIIPLFHA